MSQKTKTSALAAATLKEVFGNNEYPLLKEYQDCSPSTCEEEEVESNGFCQWIRTDDDVFIPARKTIPQIEPGIYETEARDGQGVVFKKIKLDSEVLINFPDSKSETVIEEIKNFWNKEEYFKKYNLRYKRGIMLLGPAGSGKSCTVRMVIRDVIKRGGICIKFWNPNLFASGLRSLRKIHPNIPIVVLMEDIEATLRMFDESLILNIIDGVEGVNKIVFLATTNYPEELGDRIINRPSRFDRRFVIDFPNEDSRRIFIESLIQEKNKDKNCINIDQWVKDTNGFSIAHIRELFIAVVLLEDKYEEALSCLKDMKSKVSSSQWENNTLGFCENSIE